MNKLRFSIITFSLCISSQFIHAQTIDITPMIGYAMRSDLRFIEGEMEVQDKINVGVNFSFPTYNENGRIEFVISNSFSSARWLASPDYADLISKTNFNMMVTYFQAFWVGEAEVQDDLYLFGGPSLGAINYSARTEEIENVLRLSVGAQAGVKYYFGNGLGFRLQCHMVLPVFMGNGEHFDGITDFGGELGYVTVNSTCFPANFIFNAGLIFKIKTGR